jgi:hypothetical protein
LLKIAKMSLSHNELSQGGECVSITESSTQQQRKITFHCPSLMKCWSGWQSILSFIFFDRYLGYHQIPIHPDDQSKTTFTCTYGTYAYCRMSFRLCNAPASFQRCMMSIFSDMIEEIIEVFMDDFLVYGKTFDHCLENLDKILQRCQEKDLVLN